MIYSIDIIHDDTLIYNINVDDDMQSNIKNICNFGMELNSIVDYVQSHNVNCLEELSKQLQKKYKIYDGNITTNDFQKYSILFHKNIVILTIN